MILVAEAISVCLGIFQKIFLNLFREIDLTSFFCLPWHSGLEENFKNPGKETRDMK